MLIAWPLTPPQHVSSIPGTKVKPQGVPGSPRAQPYNNLFLLKEQAFSVFLLNCKILFFAQVIHPIPFILKYSIRRQNLFFLLLSGKFGFIYLLITNSLIGFRSCICGVSHWHTLSLPYSEKGVWIEGNYLHLLPAGFVNKVLSRWQKLWSRQRRKKLTPKARLASAKGAPWGVREHAPLEKVWNLGL